MIRYLFITTFLVFTFQLQAQNDPAPLINSTLDGVILDANTNLPLEGAVIKIKGTTHQVVSDRRGNFAFKTGQKFPYNLIVSFVGYETLEFYANEKQVKILLKPQVKEQDEIVIVGYGVQTRKSLVGSIAKINANATKQIPVASVDAQLQGQAAGVQINSFSGTPGESIKALIRGTTSVNASNEPLYVIDGVFVNSNSLASINLGSKRTSPLADLNPSDIESIEVLKDASAIAIYGSRGANGVILITTKRGQYNSGKPKVSLDVSSGWQKADESRLWKLTTGSEHAAIVNEQWINSGIDNPALNQTFANRPFRPRNEIINGVPGRGTPEEQATIDRLGRVLRTGKIHNLDLNVSGGTDKVKYNFGIGYANQEGILKPARFERRSGKFNFDAKLFPTLTFSSSNTVGRSFRQQVRGGAGQEAGHLLAALHHPTYMPLYDSLGNAIRPSIYENIDLLTNTDAVNISTASIRYLGNHSLEWELIPNLKFKTSFGLDYNDYREREFFNDKTNIGTSIAPLLGFRSEAYTTNVIFQNEQLVSYFFNAGKKHNFSVLAGNSIQTNTFNFLRAQGQGFPSNQLQQISSAAVRTSSQNQSKSTLASFFGRINYNYVNKYFFEASLRADGSSKFGTNNKWGFFPAAGFSWRAKQEPFLSKIKYLNEFKFRASVGSAGNQNGVSDYGSRGLWTSNAIYPDSLTGGFRPGTAPSQLGNEDLRWEKTTTYNAGVDVGLFNRLYITLDAYYKYTTDVLLPLPIPRATGFTSILSNAGIVSNQGIELSVTSTNIKKKNFEWTTNFNIARNVNRAEKLINPITFEAREYRRTQEGAALGSYWLYKQLYVDPQTGNAVFDDVDKDGKLTQADRQLLGNVLPDFFGGITNTFSYKGFSLNVLFTYQYGNELFNFNKYILEGGGTRDASRSLLKSQLDRWQKPGDITNTPRVTSVGNNYNIEQNSRYLEDASFIRLKSVQLTYTLPSSITSKVRLGKVSFFAIGTNLLVFTKYSGPDPEASGSAIQNLDGLDTATPPQPIGLLLGARINF